MRWLCQVFAVVDTLNKFSNIYSKIRFWILDNKIKVGASKSPLRVIIGTSGVTQKGWLATDIEQLNMIKTSDWQRYFRPNSIDALLAEHVWEHLIEADAITAAKNCYIYLKPGGYLRVAVPDGFHSLTEYRDAVKPMGSGLGSDDHKVLFTHISLTNIFETAGFDVELLEYFDERGAFHHKAWDTEAGFVTRSMKFDGRNSDGKPNYTSIILDAWKKAEHQK
jgi:predicted SAM-dependent methyltransferase